tara:strand:+ start:8082 stop:10292 length:2211 start_codon:yes stop_codon:yes gene_type:complete
MSVKITLTKAIIAHPFKPGGQGARLATNLSDPTYFTPPRRVPLHTSPRVYTASDVVSDLPLSLEVRRIIVDALQFGVSFEHTYNAIKDAMQSEPTHLRGEVMNRVRSFFRTTKALQDESGRGIGRADLFDTIDGDINKLQAEIQKRRAEREKGERKEKAQAQRIKQGTVNPVRGHRSDEDTIRDQAKAWLETASEDEKKAIVKAAKKHLKSNELEIPDDTSAIIAAANINNADLDPVLDGQIDSALEDQQEMTAFIKNAVREQKTAVVARLNKDRQREIDRAFAELPAEAFEFTGQHHNQSITKPSVREAILLEEGFKPQNAALSKDASIDEILAAATEQGVFDSKEARRKLAESANHVEQWTDEKKKSWGRLSGRKVSDTDQSDHAPSQTQGDHEPPEDSEGGLPQGVIAIGPRGGQIVGYNGSRPIYKKGGGEKKESSPKPSKPEGDERKKVDYHQPTQRSIPVSQTKSDTRPIQKTLNLAETFAEQVIGRPIKDGCIVKSQTERLISDLDDTYERIVSLRAHMKPHHTAMHNEAIHRLREAHANPNKQRNSDAVRFAEHFMETVVSEHDMAAASIKECTKYKETKKAMRIVVGKGGLFTLDQTEKKQTALTHKAALNLIEDHNATCPPHQDIDLEHAKEIITKSSNGAQRRALELIERTAQRVFLAMTSLDDNLEHVRQLAKGTRANKEGDDLDVDVDDFEDDQSQLEDDVNEGIDEEDEEEEDDEDEEKDDD